MELSLSAPQQGGLVGRRRNTYVGTTASTCSFMVVPARHFARWTIDADAQDLHEHHHPYEEVWNIVGGHVTLIVDGVEEKLEAGAAAVVPPNTAHSVRVTGAAEVVVTDFPVRHDLPGVER